MTDYRAGQVRPDDNETINLTAAFLRQHANSIQVGTNVILLGTSNTGQWIDFPEPFHDVDKPMVFCTVMGVALNVISDIRWGSTQGASDGIAAYNRFYFQAQVSSGSRNVRVMWIAYGRGTEVGG